MTTDLAAIRRVYARRAMAANGVSHPALLHAFATVPRENFLGPGPWTIFRSTGMSETLSADPLEIYDDVLVSLIPERRLNNGQPSGHAMWLAAADPRPGDHAVHVGAGTGYYTAILATLVGPAGRVTAIEYDPGLAAKAKANLAPWSNVEAVQGDGVTYEFDPADVIYVNAGVTRPADSWLDRLKQGGRLVLPLTAVAMAGSFPAGAVFRITRDGEAFSAQFVSPTAFIPCEGLREPASGEALDAAFRRGGVQLVRRLVRANDVPPDQVWMQAPDWALCF
jgi:protein-L-isoaspartate(D-aspartate) O-methyltransferase